jgi:hypothetical protein
MPGSGQFRCRASPDVVTCDDDAALGLATLTAAALLERRRSGRCGRRTGEFLLPYDRISATPSSPGPLKVRASSSSAVVLPAESGQHVADRRSEGRRGRLPFHPSVEEEETDSSFIASSIA